MKLSQYIPGHVSHSPGHLVWTVSEQQSLDWSIFAHHPSKSSHFFPVSGIEQNNCSYVHKNSFFHKTCQFYKKSTIQQFTAWVGSCRFSCTSRCSWSGNICKETWFCHSINIFLYNAVIIFFSATYHYRPISIYDIPSHDTTIPPFHSLSQGRELSTPPERKR